MCGIAGFFSPSKKVSRTHLSSMTDAISHRGPDASGYYFNADETVGFGHRRLSIIDLSTAANQPIYSQCGRYVIVFNGEIYNYREIAQDLKVQLKTTSDTEVLVEAFAQWGEDFVHRLNGMFAFAIFDTRLGKLYIYKDRLGIKPLYYFADGNEFYFSSELKSFTRTPGINLGEISHSAIYHFLYLGYIPTPLSIHTNIKKMEAGSYAVVDKNETTFKRYWRLEDQIEAQVITDEATGLKEFEDLLNSSVAYRMISDVPFGTFLSGGIDSSLVTAVAQKNSSTPINTFTIGFEEQGLSEVEYARKVSKHLGTNHHEMVCSFTTALEMFDEALEVYDEPYADTSLFPTLLVSKFARQHVTMILSGDGGDETYLGYGFYNWGNRLTQPWVYPMKDAIKTLFSVIPDVRFRRAANMFDFSHASHLKSHIYSQEQYYFSERDLQRLLKTNTERLILDENVQSEKRNITFNEAQSIFDLRYYMHDELLVKVDRASMRHSLEVRVPLLDYRLVKFAMNLHPSLRKKGDVTKYLMKKALYKMVPAAYFERPKWGFGMPVRKWLGKEWSHLIDEYLSEQMIKQTGVLEPKVVSEIVRKFRAGEDYLCYRIWLLIVFQKWMITYQNKK